jgi:hypothetical protein
MATNQSQYQDQNVISLEAYRQDRNRIRVHELGIERDNEVLTAIKFIETAIRAFGATPEKLREITTEPEQPTAPVIDATDKFAERAAQAQAVSYEHIADTEAQKITTEPHDPSELDTQALLAAVHEVHDQALTGTNNQ